MSDATPTSPATRKSDAFRRAWATVNCINGGVCIGMGLILQNHGDPLGFWAIVVGMFVACFGAAGQFLPEICDAIGVKR